MSENLENNTQKTSEELAVEKQFEQKKAIDRIIRGVNDVFEKTYDFAEFDEPFTVKLRAPNALDAGKIHSRTAVYLNGMNNYASDYFIVSYNALASLRVVGIDVPKELANDEDIYNLDVLYTIGKDFQEWLNSFRR
ncbi:tail tape measure protein [Bacillus phage SDFMU_Pbc]|uniref:Tail tape measure protein n=1 Tax=Bacillus phage SDFMU_Pbc TaxID=3076135 RepID=A0AA96R5L1_9CAUD|nr:tail tape measure protein [Bacillus phage SDFMU_Pbc]